MNKPVLIILTAIALTSLSFGTKTFDVKINWKSGIAMIISTLANIQDQSTITSLHATDGSEEVTTTTSVSEFVDYAKSLIGTPYVWGSTDPKVGFDCSGFINHVSNHFGFKVPRSSVQFTDIGEEVQVNDARAGDIILFTGTDPSSRIVGHMGIVTENNDDELHFVHSSSGKLKGVGISALEGYYQTRFVKVIRIFPLV